jgi:hypothetical protein
LGGVAAVQRECDSEDEAGGRATEQEGGCGDFFGLPKSADGLVLRGVGDIEFPLAIMWVTIGVSNVPGQTALMRTARGADSSTALRVRPITPCLEAW